MQSILGVLRRVWIVAVLVAVADLAVHAMNHNLTVILLGHRDGLLDTLLLRSWPRAYSG